MTVKKPIQFRAVHTKTRWRSTSHESIANALGKKRGAKALFDHLNKVIDYAEHGEPLYVIIWDERQRGSGEIVKPDHSKWDGLEHAAITDEEIDHYESSALPSDEELEQLFLRSTRSKPKVLPQSPAAGQADSLGCAGMPLLPSPNLGPYLDSLGTVAKTMSFAAIEAVLGKSLPHIARWDRTWWRNPRQPTSTRWEAFCSGAGWECVYIETKNEFAIFKTLADVPVPVAAVSIDEAAEGCDQDAAVLERVLLERTDIGPTQKQQLINARRGQGSFRANVQLHEKSCRLTQVSDPEHLRASHIKPWKDSSDMEKIDGSNGLFLAPHIDHLFDRGFISFDDSGQLLISSSLTPTVANSWGIATGINVGSFTGKQKSYLAYHRQKVFKD